MTRSAARLFRLDPGSSGLGLSCDEAGLSLAGVALLRKTEAGFESRSPEELDLLLKSAGVDGEPPLALSPSGLASVAEALNRGDLAKAQMRALFLHAPTLDVDGAARLAEADEALAKAGYNPEEDRDHGRWADDDDGANSPEDVTTHPAPKASNPVGESSPAATAASGAPKPAFKPGAACAQLESNNDPSRVSHPSGDPGKTSYGTFQIKKDNVEKFISAEGAKWPELQGKPPGSPQLEAAWRAVAKKDRQAFADAQYAFIDRTHYQPQRALIQQASGVDVAGRSHTLQEVVFTTAVQHGPSTGLIVHSIRTAEAKDVQPTAPGFDAAVLNAFYDEKGRRNAAGVLVHFHSSSKDEQRDIAKRIVGERRDMLAALAAERD